MKGIRTYTQVIITGLACILAMLLISPAAAAISDIPAGGTVFIGEEGVDITACGVADGDTLGWFAAGRSPATGDPDTTVVVSDATSFFVSPQIFSDRIGVWYNLATGNPAFMVADPFLQIRVFDVDYGAIDRTGLWVPMDFELQFRITTNLDAMAQRPGVTGAPIEVRVTGEEGVEYSALSNRAGVSTPLIFAVDRSPFMTGGIWYPDAGYSRGVYDFYAFCDANNMKDNYHVVGKTITARDESVSLSRTTIPTITTPPVTPLPTAPPTPEPTTLPATPTPAETPPVTETPVVPTPTPEPAPASALIALVALTLVICLLIRK
ncbi:hypothetical protein RJ53_06580 [Methanocalculus chunghsingensis]|uniref:DUF3821 domain-containing protein n=1 Tax=Methanocalculus chunghsingensis TaxID=156457 RepID=A0A8J8B4C4_9EURY|nr:DUF3821 domain-containing protein [Methanocalculus chunghsingensis]MBR1369175.1 hypothetical protein [Methanocalculus chunghsingensis]